MPRAKNDLDAVGAHSRSILATADPATRKAIAAARRRYLADARELDAWGRAGFVSRRAEESGAWPDGRTVHYEDVEASIELDGLDFATDEEGE